MNLEFHHEGLRIECYDKESDRAAEGYIRLTAHDVETYHTVVPGQFAGFAERIETSSETRLIGDSFQLSYVSSHEIEIVVLREDDETPRFVLSDEDLDRFLTFLRDVDSHITPPWMS